MSQNTSNDLDYIPIFPPKSRRRSRDANGNPNPVDVHVGQRLLRLNFKRYVQ